MANPALPRAGLKVSRPAVYTFVAAVAAYAAVLLTQPDPPAQHRRTHALRRAQAGADAPDDAAAHFARYRAGARNPFLSRLPAVKASTKTPDAGKNGNKNGDKNGGEWALTGINTIGGVPNALVENGATGDSVFLKPDSRWRGLRVLSIGTDTVAFVNALGQKTHLSFRPLEAAPGAREPSGGLRVQGLGTLQPLPVRPGDPRPPGSPDARANSRALPVLPPLGTTLPPQAR